MAWLFGALAVTMGIVFLWGLLAPRSQWRVLASWSVSNPHANEPGGAGYALRRLISGLGALGMVAVLAVTSSSALLAQLPREGPVLSPLQLMWGTPTPQLVDRVVHARTTPQEGLVSEPLLGYQDLDEGIPDYLLTIKHFTLLGVEDIPGYLGSEPDEGSSAIGLADLVVNVRGPVLCVPREVTVIETETDVQIGIYYGLPDPADGSVPDHLTGCADHSVTGSVLIPIPLDEPLGDRVVQGLDGTKIPRVKVIG